MDYETLTNEQIYELAFYQEDQQAQEERMRRLRLQYIKALLERSESS
jgi:hypothetical protein